MQEIQKEILRLKPLTSQITPIDLSIVLKNVNARVRYNNLTPKEVLFRRNILFNEPEDISDVVIAEKQEKNKITNSKSSKKFKAKFKHQTPCQSFAVGDLVMLREGRSKTQPRVTYIVEQLPTSDNKYILIRKLNNSLRPRLYKVLPDEIFPALDAEKPIKSHGEEQSVNKAVDINTVKPKHTKFKHGWLECEQVFEPEYTFLHITHDGESQSDMSTNSTITEQTPSPATLNESPAQSSTSDEDGDYIWDTSPEQYNLSFTQDPPDAWSPTPFIPSTQPPTIPPAFPRNRHNAFSQPPLTRSNAFRKPPSNQAFALTPPQAGLYQRPSRIPLPTSPSAVDLSLVSDVSLLLPLVPDTDSQQNPNPNLRRSTRLSIRPNYLGIGHQERGGREREVKEETLRKPI